AYACTLRFVDDVARALDVDGLERRLGRRLLDDAGDVHHGCTAVRRAGDGPGIADVAGERLHTFIPLAVRLLRSARQQAHLMAAAEQLVDRGPAYDAGSARDENSHTTSSMDRLEMQKGCRSALPLRRAHPMFRASPSWRPELRNLHRALLLVSLLSAGCAPLRGLLPAEGSPV